MGGGRVFTNAFEVNVDRRILFAKGGRTIQNIPPTLDALKQHIKRSAFQAIKWSRCLIKNPFLSLGMELTSNRVGSILLFGLTCRRLQKFVVSYLL